MPSAVKPTTRLCCNSDGPGCSPTPGRNEMIYSATLYCSPVSPSASWWGCFIQQVESLGVRATHARDYNWLLFFYSLDYFSQVNQESQSLRQVSKRLILMQITLNSEQNIYHWSSPSGELKKKN